ncbi:MAG: GNAT family N-acetyltransferase [Gammaproteobacteria bacterium]|nr:GNAT family N-acetyltransferase [Gammaproteobacteria bacterium]MCW8924151.1 GNAT family N-acetyltransferase [Gammaproteobacteria bacterium]
MQSDLLSDLEFEFSIKPSDMEEFNHLLLDFQGKAILWDDDTAEDKVVATIKGQRIDISLARKSFDNLQELFDSISPEISDLGTHILSNNNCFLESFSKDESEETPCSGLVYIAELMVEPEYRNHGLGTEMMKRMSQVVDMNNALVALKAVPIVDEESEQRTPELKNQLKRFYTKIGFRHSGEHYMVKDARDCHAQRMRALAEAGIKPPTT